MTRYVHEPENKASAPRTELEADKFGIDLSSAYSKLLDVLSKHRVTDSNAVLVRVFTFNSLSIILDKFLLILILKSRVYFMASMRQPYFCNTDATINNHRCFFYAITMKAHQLDHLPVS